MPFSPFELAIVCLLALNLILLITLLMRSWTEFGNSAEILTKLAVLESKTGQLPSREEHLGASGQINNILETRLNSLEDKITNTGAAQVNIIETKFGNIDTRINDFTKLETTILSEMRIEAADGRAKLESSFKDSASSFAQSQSDRLTETNQAVKDLAETLMRALETASRNQKDALKEVTDKISELTRANSAGQEKMTDTLASAVKNLQTNNDEKLEQMRATVDEKLQGTLEKRIGDSFQQVSERLERVHQGLGEMQNLASGVGDLKRVLSNVKSRGGWGEAQLGMLLEDMLTNDQYGTNVRIRSNSQEMVEFAIRLPGRGNDDTPLWLPIDSKFPHEDYDRLLIAQEAGDKTEVETHSAAIEKAIRVQAKILSDKYIHPPQTTDFAIMYLPTEGLFAEVIRRPGLARDIQLKFRVMIQGPTTLGAMLSSLQMGFRTLAIEKRSSEVWQVLGQAKAEFEKYGMLWAKLGKQLNTAQQTVEEVSRRTRVITSKLKNVETVKIAADTDPLSTIAYTSSAVDHGGNDNEDLELLGSTIGDDKSSELFDDK